MPRLEQVHHHCLRIVCKLLRNVVSCVLEQLHWIRLQLTHHVFVSLHLLIQRIHLLSSLSFVSKVLFAVNLGLLARSPAASFPSRLLLQKPQDHVCFQRVQVNRQCALLQASDSVGLLENLCKTFLDFLMSSESSEWGLVCPFDLLTSDRSQYR